MKREFGWTSPEEEKLHLLFGLTVPHDEHPCLRLAGVVSHLYLHPHLMVQHLAVGLVGIPVLRLMLLAAAAQ